MESFGAFIKAEREKKGISLREISNITKISHHILEALESDHVEEFPYPAFAKGFLNTYAKQLGLNSHEVISRYVDFVSHTHSIDENAFIFNDRQQIGRVGFDQNKILTRAERIEKKRAIPSFVLVLLLVGIWFGMSIFIKQTKLSMRGPNHNPFIKKRIEKIRGGGPKMAKEIASISDSEIMDPPEIENKSDIPAEIQTPIEASSGNEKEPLEMPKIEKPSMPSTENAFEAELPGIQDSQFLVESPVQNLWPQKELIINANEKTWIEVKIDDNPSYDFILEANDRVKLKARSKFSLLIGNAGGVALTYEGEPLSPIGELNEVVRLNFPE